MRRRVWVLAGTITLSLSALLSLIWLMSSSPLVAHAEPVDIPRKSTTNVPPDGPIKQAAGGSCIEINSDIGVSTTWTASCYRIMTSTVTVHNGAILTIAPITSTRVEFQARAQLQVLGNLQALGAATRPITFTSVNTTSASRGDWIGIILEQDSGGDVIQYATIEYANTGVKINDEDYVSIVSNTFRYNGGSTSTSGAIGGDIDNSRIANNRIHNCTNGMALTEAGHNTIISNTIDDIDGYGILLFEGGVGGGRDNDIVDNVIAHCTRGGLRLEAGDNNRVFSNTIYLNPGGGMYLDEQALTSVRHNYVYSNGGGSDYRAAVLITNTTFLSELSHNVVYDEYTETIEYDGYNGTVGGPMASNALCSIPSFELRNGVADTVDAPTNWWSTNTPTDSVSGLVDFRPWIRLSLAGSVDGIVTVELQDPSGNTVPPTAHRLTDPPAPNARRIELTSNWGTLSPAVVLVNDAGTATSALLPEATPGPETIVITATDFCGYPVTATIELPNLAITKTAAVTQVAAGDVLTYLISYANTGGGAATDVRITDTLPAGTVWAGDTAPASGWTRLSTAPSTWSTPTLSPGAHGSFVLSVTVDPAACGLSLTNRVTIGTSILETRMDDNVADSPPVSVVCTDLSIFKFARPPAGPPGAPIHFTVVYTNNSNDIVANAVITDWLPADTAYVSDTSGLPVTALPGGVRWTIPSIPPQHSGSFTITLDHTSTECPATLYNTVVISSAAYELTPENNQYTATYQVICDVDLVVVKDDDVGPTTALNASLPADKQSAVARVLHTAGQEATMALAQHREFVYEGDLVTYTIAVVNAGTYTATNVVLTETMPAEYVDYVGYGWISISSTTYITTVGTLPPGDGRVVYFVVRVHDSLPAGVDNLVNRVCGGSDGSDVTPEDNCNYEDTPVRPRPLQVGKRAEPCIAPGDEFEYSITYTNTTTHTTFSNVAITDTLDPYVSYVGGPADGWTCAAQVCTQTIPTIPPATRGTLRLPVQLSATFPYTHRTSFTNVVEIEWGNRFTLTTSIDLGPDLSVVKNDNVGPLPVAQQTRWRALDRRLRPLRLFSPLQVAQHREFVRPGERITYTILYVNDGFGAAVGVVLTEILPEYTTYVGSGWTHAGGRRYTMNVGDLAPGQGGEVQFIVQVDDPFPPGVDRVINRVDIGGETPECDETNNWSTDDTPVHTDLRLYVANRNTGTLDVFNTTDFGYLRTIAAGANPFGMATDGNLLFVTDFDEPALQGSLYVVDTLSDTVVGSTAGLGAHPAHVAVLDDHVFVASHSGQPPITIASTESPWDVVAQPLLDRPLTYEFGLFGATADEERGYIYFTKPDFGSMGIWRLDPVSPTWSLEYVYPVDEAPRSILYHEPADRVYAVFGFEDELWVFDPEGWELEEQIPTGHQDSNYPGYSGHGLAAQGQCVFVSNYRDESVTAVVDGSCVERPESGSAPAPPAGPHRVYLPLVGRNFAPGRRVVTIPLSGRPQGMTAAGNLLFVTLPREDRVAIIDTETLTVIREIETEGDYPHTVILAGGNYLSPGP